MNKPNFFKTLWLYTRAAITIPFYEAWVHRTWKTYEKIYMAILCLLFWWIIAPILAVIEYKADVKNYKASEVSK